MKKYIIGFVIFFFMALTFALSFFVVNEDEYVCVVRFQKVIEIKKEAGLYFKVPFVDEVKSYSKNYSLYDIKQSDVITKEKQVLNVDSYIMWKISDPLTFIKTVGGVTEAEGRLDAIAYNAMKVKLGTLEMNEIVSMGNVDTRNRIYGEILDSVKEGAVSYGIDVFDVKIRRMDLPESNQNAVYTRMISERNKIAQSKISEGERDATNKKSEVDKEYNTKLSDAKATAEQTIAEGEAEYMKIIADTYNTPEKLEFYKFIRSLDALKNSMTGEQKTIILDKDSPIAKILLNAE